MQPWHSDYLGRYFKSIAKSTYILHICTDDFRLSLYQKIWDTVSSFSALAGGICGNHAMFWALCEAFIILFKNPYPKFIPPQSVCKYDGKCVESGCLCSPWWSAMVDHPFKSTSTTFQKLQKKAKVRRPALKPTRANKTKDAAAWAAFKNIVLVNNLPQG